MNRYLYIALLLFIPSICHAEAVVLKNGKIIEGRIIEDTEESIKIETKDDKSLHFYKNDIEIIEDDTGEVSFLQNYKIKENLHKNLEILRALVKRWNINITHYKLALEYQAKGDYARSYQELLNSNLIGIIITLILLWDLILSGVITGCLFLIFYLFFKKKQSRREEFLFRPSDLYIMLVLMFAIPSIMASIILPLNYYFTDFFKYTHINPLVLSGLLSNFFLVGICFAFLKNKYRLDNATLGFVSHGYKFNIVLPIALAIGVILILFLFVGLLNMGGIKPPPHPLEDLLHNIFKDGNITSILFLFFMVAIVAPIAEEMMFRVFLLNFFKRYTSLVFAVILSTILFALFHQRLICIPYYFLIGIILAITYVKTKTIIPSMVTHGIYNFIILLLGWMYSKILNIGF